MKTWKCFHSNLLILRADQNKMKVAGVFWLVEQVMVVVMAYEQMKPYREEEEVVVVDVVVVVVVLQWWLFLIVGEKKTNWSSEFQTIPVIRLPIFSISTSLEVTRFKGRHIGWGVEKQ